MTTTTQSARNCAVWVEYSAMTVTLTALSVAPMRYQLFLVKVVSTIGAHKNFQARGARYSAISNPI